MKKQQAILFDLDGTLLNTLDDLTSSVNVTLQAHGFPLRRKEEIRNHCHAFTVPISIMPSIRRQKRCFLKYTY